MRRAWGARASDRTVIPPETGATEVEMVVEEVGSDPIMNFVCSSRKRKIKSNTNSRRSLVVVVVLDVVGS